MGLSGRYPDDEVGQIPMAFVVRKSDSNLSEEDVINFIAKQVIKRFDILFVSLTHSQPKTLVYSVGYLLISK